MCVSVTAVIFRFSALAQSSQAAVSRRGSTAIASRVSWHASRKPVCARSGSWNRLKIIVSGTSPGRPCVLACRPALRQAGGLRRNFSGTPRTVRESPEGTVAHQERLDCFRAYGPLQPAAYFRYGQRFRRLLEHRQDRGPVVAVAVTCGAELPHAVAACILEHRQSRPGDDAEHVAARHLPEPFRTYPAEGLHPFTEILRSTSQFT